jgi:hypothetical protein
MGRARLKAATRATERIYRTALAISERHSDADSRARFRRRILHQKKFLAETVPRYQHGAISLRRGLWCSFAFGGVAAAQDAEAAGSRAQETSALLLTLEESSCTGLQSRRWR